MKSMRTAVPPPPGSLVLLNDENPYLAGALGLVLDGRKWWTDTDYLGRPYVWVNLPTAFESRGVIQIPQFYIRTVLSTPEGEDRGREDGTAGA